MNSSPSNRRNAVLIFVDRLQAGYLGPYGNTWVETPGLNRLASQSLLWEYMISTQPTLVGTYQSLSVGRHPMASTPTSAPDLWQQLQQSGVRTTLLTDEPLLRQLSITSAFDEPIEHQVEHIQAAGASWEETQLCRMFVAALDWLANPPDQFCLLLHCRGLGGFWDAPREFRERFADEEDPPVPDFVEPPNRSLGQNVDPDEILGITQSYAGQIALLDMCLEMLLDWFAEHELRNDTLLIVTSPRGYPLGEHGHIGEYGDLLHEELLHVPLLIRRPDQRYAMERSQMLVEPADLFATVADWFQLISEPNKSQAISLLHPSPPEDVRRECVVSLRDHARSIRTPAWFLRRTNDQPPELYAKPDDRWEVNEVADRCGDIAEQLSARMVEYEQLAAEDRLADFPALPEHLVRRTD